MIYFFYRLPIIYLGRRTDPVPDGLGDVVVLRETEEEDTIGENRGGKNGRWELRTKRQRDRPTDGQTDRQTDRRWVLCSSVLVLLLCSFCSLSSESSVMTRLGLAGRAESKRRSKNSAPNRDEQTMKIQSGQKRCRH